MLTEEVSSDSATVSGLKVKWKAGVYYNGSKPVLDDLDIELHINKADSQYEGCWVPASSIKVVGSNKKKAGAFKFRVRNIKGKAFVVSGNEFGGWKDLKSKDEKDEETKAANYYVGDPDKVTSSGLSSKQQKLAWKELKAYLKQVKSHEFTATIVPRTIYTAIDKSLLPKKNKRISYECYEYGTDTVSKVYAYDPNKKRYHDNDVSSNFGLEHTIAVDSKGRAYTIEVKEVAETVRLANGSTAKVKPTDHDSFYPGYVGKYKISYKQIKKKNVSITNGVLTINDDNYAVVKDLKVRTSK